MDVLHMTFLATFRPKKLDTLKPHMHTLINYTARWDYSGIMEEGTYAGQAIYHMNRDDPRYRETQCVWVPEEDLERVAPN